MSVFCILNKMRYGKGSFWALKKNIILTGNFPAGLRLKICLVLKLKNKKVFLQKVFMVKKA